MKRTRTTLSVVEKLIEQRRLFQDWMTKLAADVDGMPPHVVERVRNDYRDRLTTVMTELAEHRDALREALEESQQRHDELDDQQQARKDELAELRLRKHVGEMDEGRFKEQSGALQATLDQLKKDLAAALRDIERYEEILDTIDEGDKAGKEAARKEEEEKREQERRAEAEAKAEAESKAKSEAATKEAAAKAEAARAVEKKQQEEAAAREPRKSQELKKPGVDELAFLRSVTTTVSAVKQPPPASAPTVPAPAPFDAAPGLVQLPAAEPAPAATQAPAAEKKEEAGLVCGECGAKNRPTEWYCEKCGAELAAF